MEDARFFNQQANRCYQLALQCFDLATAHKLNLMGNASFVRRNSEGLANMSATIGVSMAYSSAAGSPAG
jgi:hypothetical protein